MIEIIHWDRNKIRTGIQAYEAAPKRPEMFYDGDIFHNIELLLLKDAYFSWFLTLFITGG